MTTKAGEQPTITQADELAVQAMLDAVSWEARTEEFNIVAGHFAHHRTTSLAAQDEGLISDKSRIERLRRLVHRWITQGQVRGVVHDMDLQCEIDDAFAWANENGISAVAPSLAAQDGLVDALKTALAKIAGSHWERFGTSQTDIEQVPDLSAEEAMNVARDALSNVPATSAAAASPIRI